MQILRTIYIVFFLIITVIFMVKKRNISFLMIYFLSSSIFYLNAFEGKIFIGQLNNNIKLQFYNLNVGTYIVLLINFGVILLFAMFEKESTYYRGVKRLVNEEMVMKFFFLGVFMLSIYLCVRHGVFIRIVSGVNVDKSALASSMGRIGSYYKHLATFGTVYMFTKEDIKFSRRWEIIAVVPILLTFFLGNRSFITIAAVAIFFKKVYVDCIEHGQRLLNYLSQHIKVVVAGFLLVFVTLVIKGVMAPIYNHNWNIIYQRLSSFEYYRRVFFVSEPNIISMNLDTIIKNDFQVESSTYSALWAYFIPIVTKYIEAYLVPTKFGLLFQQALYVDTTNLASSYLGEAYANGGYITVFIVVILYLLLLLLIFMGFQKCSSNIAKTTFLLIGIDAAFYIQRNSMAYEFSRLRLYIYIAVMLYFFIGLMNHKHTIRF